MNDGEKLKLKEMINQADCDDNTGQIRKLKHSTNIRDDIRTIEKIKIDNPGATKDELHVLCISKASFLYNNYTDIYHKVIASELDLHIMTNILAVLKKIEHEEVDQHEGSFLVGKLLKELYVDSALRRSEHLDEKNSGDAPTINSGTALSWKQYKSMKNL
jgi:hypothetical protein